MPTASSIRSPRAFTSRPTNGAITNRINANALTTAPAAALPTPNSRAKSGSAGATRPKPSATMKATPVSARTSGGRSRNRRTPATLLDRKTEPAGDQHPLHLGGPLADLEHLGVAVEAGHGVLLHEAVPTEDLRRDPGGGDRRLGRVELGDGRGLLELAGPGAAAVAHRVLHGRRPVDQQP